MIHWWRWLYSHQNISFYCENWLVHTRWPWLVHLATQAFTKSHSVLLLYTAYCRMVGPWKGHLWLWIVQLLAWIPCSQTRGPIGVGANCNVHIRTVKWAYSRPVEMATYSVFVQNRALIDLVLPVKKIVLLGQDAHINVRQSWSSCNLAARQAFTSSWRSSDENIRLNATGSSHFNSW